MKPVTYNFKTHVRGDGFNGVQFTLSNITTATPIDLTAAIIRCQFRKGSKSGGLSLDLSIGNGITVDDAVNGTFTLDAISSMELAVSIYYYDVEVTFSSGVVKTYVQGVLEIVNDVTR